MATGKGAGHAWTPPDYALETDVAGFDPPDDPSIGLWRYMDFTKFVSMLEGRSLFFARTDLMGDPFEGSLTRAEAEARREFEERLRQAGEPMVLHGTVGPKVRAEIRNGIVSCWHMNEVESMAMWRLYLTGSEGVAVRSTFDRFVSSFPPFDGQDKGLNDDGTERELRVRVGTVHYVDYDGVTPDDVPRILLKRRSFEHEREIRAVAMDRSWGNSPRFGPDDEPLTRFANGGDHVPVDLAKLISDVYVVPEAQGWFAELVKSVVRRYGFDFPVHQSDLDRDPVF
jgi:hypothetical protein